MRSRMAWPSSISGSSRHALPPALEHAQSATSTLRSWTTCAALAQGAKSRDAQMGMLASSPQEWFVARCATDVT